MKRFLSLKNSFSYSCPDLFIHRPHEEIKKSTITVHRHTPWNYEVKVTIDDKAESIEFSSSQDRDEFYTSLVHHFEQGIKE